MELKEITQGSVILSTTLFQSHLYGIESLRGSYLIHASNVSIAPLWNWKFQISSGYRCPKRFNRTFMELKDSDGNPVTDVDTVSIAPLWNWKISVVMVSTGNSIVSIAPLWNWKVSHDYISANHRLFQSHLYGIERKMVLYIRYWTKVSIAPLWNWKVVMFLLWLPLLQFQSHLYGIESVQEQWNQSWHQRFNRTFMELKVARLYLWRWSSSVSIAPLWNWKWEQYNSERWNMLFQSHLYGIES